MGRMDPVDSCPPMEVACPPADHKKRSAHPPFLLAETGERAPGDGSDASRATTSCASTRASGAGEARNGPPRADDDAPATTSGLVSLHEGTRPW